MTQAVAARGSRVSSPGQTLQPGHFAIGLDNRVISVPFIDFKQYPDGINGDQGADIAGCSPPSQPAISRSCSADGPCW